MKNYLSMNMRMLFTGCLIAVIIFSGCTRGTEQPVNDKEAARWAEKTLSSLTLEKKIGQMICSDISGTYLPEDDPKFQSWLKLAGEYGIGGFVLYKGTPYNVARVINRLQQEAEIPLLISADFEGGAGQQVTGATEFPGNMGFAATRDDSLMYRAAKVMAAEGHAMGIRLSYTPVTDVSVTPDNPQESVRSFGGDIALMEKMLNAYVRGYREMGMINTSKHFPGRGDMRIFPDFPGFNYLDKSAQAYEENELRAFQYAVNAGVAFIMTEHVAVPSLTGGSKLPASVEPLLVKGIIRDRLGFKGIITTDDLWYDHVVARFGTEEVALKALEAGHDILLKPKDPVAVIQAVAEAVKSGRIPEQQINESVYKLLYQKALLGLHKNRFVDETQIGTAVGTAGHRKLAEEVADRSVTLLKNDAVLPIKELDKKQMVHIIIQKTENQPNVDLLEGKMSSLFSNIRQYRLTPGTREQEYDAIEKAIRGADLVILSFFVQRERHVDCAPVRDADLKLLQKIFREKPRSVLAMSYGNPHIIKKIQNVPAFMTGYGEGGWYGNQVVYIDSFIRVLKGELVPSGKLPLAVSDEYPTGSGITY